jgi:hypothetical protein
MFGSPIWYYFPKTWIGDGAIIRPNGAAEGMVTPHSIMAGSTERLIRFENEVFDLLLSFW